METLEQKYEHEKVGKLLMMFSVPSVISLVLNALYNMVDQIFIGNGVGYLGNGATNVIFPLTQLAIAIGLLIGDGTASYMNLKLGEGKREDAEKGMAAGLVALMISGVTLSILLTVFLQPLCRLFGATDDIMQNPMSTIPKRLVMDSRIWRSICVYCHWIITTQFSICVVACAVHMNARPFWTACNTALN